MKKFLAEAWEVAEVVIVSVVSIFIVYGFIAKPYVVEGKSMEPNFQDGNYLIVDEITYRFREPARGEVIVFRNPGNEKEFYIKRIIGLPSETVDVDIKENAVKIDGKILSQDYLPQDTPFCSSAQSPSCRNVSFRLRNDQYFVMGDNRPQSYDSRSWGPLKRNEIVGEVRLRFWPLDQVNIYK